MVVWPMVKFEADDAMATGAARWRDAKGVEQIVICTPDKDLTQCVVGKRVVCWDRRRQRVLDEKGVEEKFGVLPESIPDWLGLVGDAADGIPGIRGWGAKSSSRVLARYRHIENIPEEAFLWEVKVQGAKRLVANLRKPPRGGEALQGCWQRCDRRAPYRGARGSKVEGGAERKVGGALQGAR